MEIHIGILLGIGTALIAIGVIIFTSFFFSGNEEESAETQPQAAQPAQPATTAPAPAQQQQPVVIQPQVYISPDGTPAGAKPQQKANTSRLNIVAIKLRTQVTSMKWFTEMLLYKEYGKLNFAQMEMLNQVREAATSATELLGQMFDDINEKSPGMPGSSSSAPIDPASAASDHSASFQIPKQS